ncbi:chemosensory receptor C [Elysia marginata]|uniref:Chemosensory receptor C n=1 Tax=Elysia marginata TaxID=1093978 RepID=A0AAV4FFG5_9GAST|nr:chemosensory receptor C [Elysia marginata]
MTNNISSIVSTDRYFGYPYKREYTLVMRYQPPFWPFLLVAGLTTNILNIITFLKVGVKDSVSILLLTISMSDACFLTLVSPVLLRHAFLSVGSYKVQALNDLRVMTFWPAFTCYDFSAYVSVVLGVTRCACVAMPLRFKSVFTKKRTIIAVGVLFCINVLIHIPVLTIFRLGLKIDPLTNKSYVGVVREGGSLETYKQRLNDTINKNTLQVISFIVLVACAALLSFKLFQTSKIRSKSAAVSDTSEKSGKSPSQSQAASHKLSPKDVRVVQSVILCVSREQEKIPIEKNQRANQLFNSSTRSSSVSKTMPSNVASRVQTSESQSVPGLDFGQNKENVPNRNAEAVVV